MYPEGNLINSEENILAQFEKDLDNPEHEGFVCYWEINNKGSYKLIFKKRLTSKKAIEKFKHLTNQGWMNSKEKDKVA